MALRNIRLDGDEILRKTCKPVKEITPKILELLDDMLETMYEKNGVGLAAPQVGILRRVVVIDIDPHDEESEPIELINPRILEQSGSQINNEGCLSIPGETGYVERPETITVEALDRFGQMQKYEAEGYLAVAFCHELDHLDGILYTDKIIEDYEDESEDDDEYDDEFDEEYYDDEE